MCRTMFHEWRQIILEHEQECAKEEMLHKDTGKEERHQQDNVKEEEQQQDNVKEEIQRKDDKPSISDMSTDDEASWVQDGVDLRGYSQVEDDNFDE